MSLSLTAQLMLPLCPTEIDIDRRWRRRRNLQKTIRASLEFQIKDFSIVDRKLPSRLRNLPKHVLQGVEVKSTSDSTDLTRKNPSETAEENKEHACIKTKIPNLKFI